MHGVAGEFGSRLWASAVRTPDRYPDAVTLTDDATEADVLAAIDDSTGASVKDSFSALDLRPHGYAVHFDAEWIHCASAAPPADAPIAWEVGPHDEMPSDEVVALTGHAHGEVVARAVANLASGVVGLSNVAASDGWLDETWRSVAAAAQAATATTVAESVTIPGAAAMAGLKKASGPGVRNRCDSSRHARRLVSAITVPPRFRAFRLARPAIQPRSGARL